MPKWLNTTVVSAGMMFRALHAGADITAVRDVPEARVVIDNSVSAVAISEDEKRLLDDVATEGQVSESQPANETHDLRQRSTDAEEAARSPGKKPESFSDEEQGNLLHAKKKQEEDDQDKADENLELGDREEVSGGNITAPASPAGGEPAITGEGPAQGPAEADEERVQAAAEADEERVQAAAEADEERAEAAARADEESHQQAAAEDEDRFGSPAEESAPADETWLEDDANVNDPDID